MLTLVSAALICFLDIKETHLSVIEELPEEFLNIIKKNKEEEQKGKIER